jgi:hypothetical protein
MGEPASAGVCRLILSGKKKKKECSFPVLYNYAGRLFIQLIPALYSGDPGYYMVTSRGCCVTYKTGFVLDDWIYFTLYIHHSGLQAMQRYRYSIHLPVHSFPSTRILSLH